MVLHMPQAKLGPGSCAGCTEARPHKDAGLGGLGWGGGGGGWHLWRVRLEQELGGPGELSGDD